MRAPLVDEKALLLSEAPIESLEDRMAEAREVRDSAFGATVTYSPKVFVPLTNLCRNRCGYCAFRRSFGQSGAHTMAPKEVLEVLAEGARAGATEALFCLGDKPELAFPGYREILSRYGHEDTTSYLVWAARAALERGLLPHTNAGVLTRADMARLQEVNVSLGVMLESTSERLCLPGMPHHFAPDKRPAVRGRMLEEAASLGIAMTTGILVGIGESRRERIASLLAIRRIHREGDRIQEVIVQNFRAHPGTPMATFPEATHDEFLLSVALARLILDPDVSIQAPPNLSDPAMCKRLLRAGINDWGGISPVTPDFINPGHAWPNVEALAGLCAEEGMRLVPRLPVYERHQDRLPAILLPHVERAKARRCG